MKTEGWRFFVGCILSMGIASSLAVSPRLSSTTPSGAQRGTEVEVKLNGSRLEDAKEVIFYSPEIEVLNLDVSTNGNVKAKLRIAKDCPLGEHLFRVRTAGGVSDLRPFRVGPFKTIEETEPNSETNKAQKVEANITVSGVVAAEDMDYFLISAKRGERVSAEVEAMRMGRGAFDAYLAIYDSNGKVLAEADDTALLRQDPFVSIVAPADGDYVVQLRETTYGGNNEYVYRLHLGNFPRPTMVYPAGGKFGETITARFLGDPTGEFTQSIKLPETYKGMFPAMAEQGITAPSPNWLRLSPFPNVLETAGNNSREKATVVEVDPPFALNGIISAKGESDWFKFTPKKAYNLDVNVYARRLRSPLDSVLEILDSDGKSIGSNDDTGGQDSSLKQNVSEGKTYYVRIKDQLGQGGPDFVYRIEATAPTSSLTLNIPQVARNDSQTRQWIAVPRGNRFATLLGARKNSVSGDVTLAMPGLPEGIRMHADTVRVDALPVVFEAAADAPLGGKLLTFTAKNDKGEIPTTYRHSLELVEGPNNTFYYGSEADRLYVAVVEEAPFKLLIEEPKAPIVQSGTMELKIRAERDSGFDEPITVRMLWNPPGISSSSDVTIPKGESTVTYPLNSKGDAEVRAWKIAVLGSATHKGGTVYASSQLAKLEVAEPYLAGKIQTLALEPGQTGKLVCKLEQKKSFEGKAVLKLMGLPEKVQASEIEISKDTAEATFELKVDSTCSFGSHKALFCSALIKHENETIQQNVGRDGILRIVPAKKKAETKVASK